MPKIYPWLEKIYNSKDSIDWLMLYLGFTQGFLEVVYKKEGQLVQF